MESLLANMGKNLENASLDEMERLWQQAKREEPAAGDRPFLSPEPKDRSDSE
jgi:hypothetical protein